MKQKMPLYLRIESWFLPDWLVEKHKVISIIIAIIITPFELTYGLIQRVLINYGKTKVKV